MSLWKMAIASFARLMFIGVIPLTAIALFALAVRSYEPAMPSAASFANGPQWSIRSPVALDEAWGKGLDLADRSNTTLAALVGSAAFASASLLVISTLAAAILGIPFGFWMAIHAPRSLLGLLRAMTNVAVAFPAFFVAFLLQIAVIELGRSTARTLVPVFGFGLDTHLVLPVASLAVAAFAYVARLIAVTADDLNARDFVRTARAKGLAEIHVVYRHIAPNMYGAIAEATLAAARLVLAGLVIVEYLVVWPGLGLLALRAINVQDLAALVASASLLGIAFLALESGIHVVTRRTGVETG